jgi:hypothetical protein
MRDMRRAFGTPATFGIKAGLLLAVSFAALANVANAH